MTEKTKNERYKYSVFYFTKSIYDGCTNQHSPAFQLIFKAVLMNTRFKLRIGTHITFTTIQILELVKSMNQAFFKGLGSFMVLGENMAFPEKVEDIEGNKDFRLVRVAVNKTGDVTGDVKIVVDDYETRQSLNKIIQDGSYPVKLIDSSSAFDELNEIEKILLSEFP